MLVTWSSVLSAYCRKDPVATSIAFLMPSMTNDWPTLTPESTRSSVDVAIRRGFWPDPFCYLSTQTNVPTRLTCPQAERHRDPFPSRVI